MKETWGMSQEDTKPTQPVSRHVEAGLEDTSSSLEKISNAVIEEAAPTLNKEQSSKAAKAIMESVDSWNEKVARGSAYTADAMPAELIKNIMLGEDGAGGLAKVFKDSGYVLAEYLGGYVAEVGASLVELSSLAHDLPDSARLCWMLPEGSGGTCPQIVCAHHFVVSVGRTWL